MIILTLEPAVWDLRINLKQHNQWLEEITSSHLSFQKRCGEFSLWRNRIGGIQSTRTQVRSPTQYSGSRIRCCHTCGLGRDCSSDLIPGPGAPYATGWPQMKKTHKQNTKQCKWSKMWHSWSYLQNRGRLSQSVVSEAREWEFGLTDTDCYI